MTLFNRRSFLTGGVAVATAAAFAAARPSRRVKAVAFDGFVIIDPRPVAALAEELFPGKGEQLVSAWRTHQFEYTWLRTLSGHYRDFWQVTSDALRFAAESLGLKLNAGVQDRLMHKYLELQAWPDVLPALNRLKSSGIRMAFLANLTAPMMDSVVANSALQGFFEEHLSTDRVRAYKPDPRAYRMGPIAFKCSPEEIVFAASAAWDAAGAKWFGYRTFWLNRSRLPQEELGVEPDATGAGMPELTQFVLGAG